MRFVVSGVLCVCWFFFFKQKTAYEMRISDWSSDVCSSDLLASILMMIALYSINLRIMGRPNVPLISEPTIFTILQPEGISDYVMRPLILLVVIVAVKLGQIGRAHV